MLVGDREESVLSAEEHIHQKQASKAHLHCILLKTDGHNPEPKKAKNAAAKAKATSLPALARTPVAMCAPLSWPLSQTHTRVEANNKMTTDGSQMTRNG